MSARYTCRACANALALEGRFLSQKRAIRAIPTLRRSIAQSAAASSQYGQRTTVQSTARLSINANEIRSYAAKASQAATPHTTITTDGQTNEIDIQTTDSSRQGSIEAYQAKILAQQEAAASGQKVGIIDDQGEAHVLAEIPDDVRTYNWRTPEWSWGVLERLFEGCEQAKVVFETEEYIDERDGKTRKRIKRDKDGLHVGHGSGWWFEELGLPQTFNTWALVAFLHMWILKVRIRQLPKKMSEHWSELLTNHFFWEAEKRMDFIHKMDGSDRKKNLEAFSQIWRGTIVAYDEGLIKGDAVLATAIWRQLFDGQENADPVKIALVTAYVRREIARLGWLEDEFIARGYVGFGEPVAEDDLVMPVSDGNA